MSTEIEIKMKIPNRSTAQRILADPQVAAHQMGPAETLAMRSVYYDTPSHQLMKWEWALRMRQEGTDSVVTLKTQQEPDALPGLFVRKEWQTQGENVYLAVEELVRLGAPQALRDVAASESFVERCQIQFQRRKLVLKLADGTRAEMAVDEGQILADGKQEPFLELELELILGQAQYLLEWAAAWEIKYQLTRELASKYERALRLIRSRPSRS